MIKKINHINERLLLLETSRGSEIAFQELFEHYKAFVYAVTFKILKTTDYSDDVLQDVFLKIWLNRSRLPDIENFKGYLTTIASNHIYNLMRKRAYESLYARRSIEDEKSIQYSLNDFHKRETASCFYADLEKGISSLTQQQQKIFRLSRIDGLKHAEIASLLHISKETVKKHVMAALHSIRNHMVYYNNIEKVWLLLFLLVK